MSLRAASPALAAAVLFGASTPFAKLLAGDVPPLLLAGLLYLGSGLGLGALLLARRTMGRQARPASGDTAGISRGDLPWLAGAVVFGGMLGPALLMGGLAGTSGAAASLLLNLEGVFTALLAWIVFRENAEHRVVLGMAAMVLGGVLLSWAPGSSSSLFHALLIVAACLCWGVDNNLTRQVSSGDAMAIACSKGLFAGACNTALALSLGAQWPSWASVSACLAVGLLGYGLSLTLFVVALRTLGTARTGAYFSTGPFFGVLLSLAVWPEVPPALFWPAALLMAAGVWLHLGERHEHEHTHELLEHAHRHVHDEHHRHDHGPEWDGTEPHVHAHRHEAMTHRHPHYPDIHHRHVH
ncbi:protein of unknown function DUF6 transmembrane [Paracidovorax avenae ATCC 19860]|uniref:EamA domain-containing protein n=1 Tax=Paracidovorax avenae (strain ATCC 19860 / DSM 7227 / CCUG 15838 / JCM 20985 / LMG 2117 / NCPPB 1011) TaxID=643561 RepID=F0Q0N0_PARA1|nr:DMT family transporter [Paracidovorax avenae]ADX46431.1 protein of unknown function DUF6 transmembrane [Paracidovorax avenae ATCC 19860]AVS67318.1 EamA family transporter [Paracidovorax avenae]